MNRLITSYQVSRDLHAAGVTARTLYLVSLHNGEETYAGWDHGVTPEKGEVPAYTIGEITALLPLRILETIPESVIRALLGCAEQSTISALLTHANEDPDNWACLLLWWIRKNGGPDTCMRLHGDVPRETESWMQLSLDITYAHPESTSVKDLEKMLLEGCDRAATAGLFVGDADAITTSWSAKVLTRTPE